jgi:elongation of very long chain fatty acids protein 6
MVHQNFSTAEFAVWKAPDGQIIHVPYTYSKQYSIEKLWNPYFIHSFFNHYWHYSLVIVVFYVTLIHAAQSWMRCRPAFDLSKVMIVWNSALAIFSMFATWRYGEEFFYVLKNRPFYHSVCYATNPSSVAAFWACCFALSKVAELIDTVFVLLRKKPLIFLHWYHHAVVLVYVWHSACELTAAGRWFIFMNYAVHSIMYTYYAITSAGFRLPRTLSMCVTTLQTTQMLIGVGISIYVARLKWTQGFSFCQQSNENLILCFVIYISFAFLFMRFFAKAYLFKKDKIKSKEA